MLNWTTRRHIDVTVASCALHWGVATANKCPTIRRAVSFTSVGYVTGFYPPGIQQQCFGFITCCSAATTAVDSECCGMPNLQSSGVGRPYRCFHQSALAASCGYRNGYSLRSFSDLLRPPWTVISFGLHTSCRRHWSSWSLFSRHWSFDCYRFPARSYGWSFISGRWRYSLEHFAGKRQLGSVAFFFRSRLKTFLFSQSFPGVIISTPALAIWSFLCL